MGIDVYFITIRQSKPEIKQNSEAENDENDVINSSTVKASHVTRVQNTANLAPDLLLKICNQRHDVVDT